MHCVNFGLSSTKRGYCQNVLTTYLPISWNNTGKMNHENSAGDWTGNVDHTNCMIPERTLRIGDNSAQGPANIFFPIINSNTTMWPSYKHWNFGVFLRVVGCQCSNKEKNMSNAKGL